MVQIRKVRKLVVVVLCVAMFFATVPLTNAAPVDYETARDPAAISAKIEQMNLPDMSDELAEELRGEGYWLPASVKSWLIKKAILFFPKKMVAALQVKLNMSASPQEIRAAFPGLYGWMISVLPYYLRPQIAHSD